MDKHNRHNKYYTVNELKALIKAYVIPLHNLGAKVNSATFNHVLHFNRVNPFCIKSCRLYFKVTGEQRVNLPKGEHIRFINFGEVVEYKGKHTGRVHQMSEYKYLISKVGQIGGVKYIKDIWYIDANNKHGVVSSMYKHVFGFTYEFKFKNKVYPYLQAREVYLNNLQKTV